MKAYLADQAEHKTEEMVEAPPPVDNHVYTKFPSWVETEADMEAFFKQQKTKVVRRDSGNHGKNPSGRVFKVDHSPKDEKKSADDEPELLQTLKEPVTVHDHAKRFRRLNRRMEADDVADAQRMMEMSLLQLDPATTK